MGHEPIIVLIPKERAKNSFEVRKLVLITLEEIEEKKLYGGNYEYYIGHDFSGLFSKVCKGEIVLPYHNKEMREVVRKGIGKIADFIKSEIEKTKKVSILASEIKKEVPEFIVYNDGDLLDAIRLEFRGIDVDMSFSKTNDLVYTFKKSHTKPEFWGEFWEKTGRYEFVELGYEDDAMIVEECLYKKIYELLIEMPEKLIDIDKGPIEKEDITSEKIIGKKWAVLVDVVD